MSESRDNPVWPFLLCCLVVGSLFLGLPPKTTAANVPAAEAQAVATANQALKDRNYDYAEKLYQEFMAHFPNSVLLPEAILGQARALYRRNKFEGASTLLRENLPRAASYADLFEYWIGECLFSEGKLDQAEASFSGLISKYPGSTNILVAAVAQADTQFQKKDFERTRALLSDPAGAFSMARARTPQAEAAINGTLLLADALYELKRFKEIEPVLATLPDTLATRPAWHRAALLARTMIATGRLTEAAAGMTNLLARATATDDPGLIAETRALDGSILEQIGRPAEALHAYEPNLKPEAPGPWRAQALAKVVQLSVASGGPTNAVNQLVLLSSQGLDAPARDLVQLTLGDLRLGLFDKLPPADRTSADQLSATASNYLFGALGNFTNVVVGFTNSPYLGKAWLGRGWCQWWLQQWPEATTAFGEAARLLPPGVDQATALFKLGDVLYQQNQFAAALTNYARLVRGLGEIPEVKEGLLDQAYYQMIQAAIQTTNQSEAEFAVKALLAQFPGKFYAERGLLLVGQFLNDIGQPAQSRAVLENFTARFPNSTLAPEIELAIARTYELESKWTETAKIYHQWIAKYTNHVSLPSAEFGYALALYRANDITNGVAGLTNFVTRFPNNELTPKAYMKLGMYYDSIREFQQAELNYQQLFTLPHSTNWPVSRLTYEARVSASRSAFERQGYSEAQYYLTNLLNNVQSCPSNDVDFVSAGCCPRDIYAEAYFAYGDVYTADSTLDATRWGTARTAFKRVVDEFPDSSLVPAAYARIGECSIQLGALSEATNAFISCMSHPLATVSQRSQAEIELGHALEVEGYKRPAAAQGPLLDAARDHYLNVFYKRNLSKDDMADNRWLQIACDSAAKLAQRRKDFDAALGLYLHLRAMLPVLSEYCDAQIRELKERSAAGG